MDDVTAITATVTACEVDECGDIRFTRTAAAGFCASVKFGNEGAGDEAAEDECDDGGDVANAQSDRNCAADESEGARSGEMFFQAFARSAPPGQ